MWSINRKWIAYFISERKTGRERGEITACSEWNDFFIFLFGVGKLTQGLAACMLDKYCSTELHPGLLESVLFVSKRQVVTKAHR